MRVMRVMAFFKKLQNKKYIFFENYIFNIKKKKSKNLSHSSLYFILLTKLKNSKEKLSDG
jgi:hypothetical protein